MAWVIWTLAMAMMPAAASSRARPSGRATPSRTAAAARSASRLDAAAQIALGIEQPQQHRRIAHRGLAPALAIAGRTRHRAGGIRPHLQRAGAIDPGDGAAAGGDGLDVEAGEAQRLAADGALAHRAGLALGDDREIRRGAAHVEGHEIAAAEAPAQLAARDDAGGGAREHHMGGIGPRRSRRRHPAIAAHQPQGTARPDIRQLRLDVAEIAVDHHTDISGKGGGIGAGIFLHLRIDGAGEIERQAGKGARQSPGQPALVAILEKGEVEADCDRLRLERAERAHDPGDLRSR